MHEAYGSLGLRHDHERRERLTTEYLVIAFPKQNAPILTIQSPKHREMPQPRGELADAVVETDRDNTKAAPQIDLPPGSISLAVWQPYPL
jgi:hypothetical protein